jgi:hypothetical protein
LIERNFSWKFIFGSLPKALLLDFCVMACLHFCFNLTHNLASEKVSK